MTNEREPTALEKALAQTETITAEIIQRAEEAEVRINILRQIQKCVDNNSRHIWQITQLRWEKPPFEIKDIHVQCENCMCAMFLGQGDNRLYVALGGLDVPLEEYLIHPTMRDADAVKSSHMIQDDEPIVDEQGNLAVGKDTMTEEWFCNHCGESFGSDSVGKTLAHECYKKHHASREGEE